MQQPWNPDSEPHVHIGVDHDERQALQAEGLDPDDPAVIAAIHLVRCEVAATYAPYRCSWGMRRSPSRRYLAVDDDEIRAAMMAAL